jgi:hypothetical protein
MSLACHICLAIRLSRQFKIADSSGYESVKALASRAAVTMDSQSKQAIPSGV